MPVVQQVLENVLRLNWSQYGQGLSGAERRTGQFFDRLEARQRHAQRRSAFGGGGGNLGQVEGVSANLERIAGASRLMGVAATAGAAGMGALLGKAAGFEQIEVGFRTMLGSAEAATAKLAELREFAAKTPFNFGDLARGSQMLLGAGASAGELIPILNALGTANAAAGKGQESLNRAILATSQIITQGTLQGDELRQLSEAGVPLNDVLKELNVSYKDVGRSGITAKQFTEALIKVMSQGRFANALANQSKTLAGSWSNLQDAGDQLATSLGTGLVPVATGTVKAITGMVDAANKLPEPVKNTAGVVGGVLVLGAAAAWAGLKALEIQNVRLMNSMLKTTLAAGAQGNAMAGMGAKAGAGAAMQAAGGGRGRGLGRVAGAAIGVGAFLGVEALAGQEGGWLNPDWSKNDGMAGAGNALKLQGKRAAEGGALGFMAGGPQGALLGVAIGTLAAAVENIGRGTGLIKPGAEKPAEKSPEVQVLEAQLAELKKQTGILDRNQKGAVSTSDVPLYRQLAARQVRVFGN